MKISGNVLETLEDLGLLNLTNLHTDKLETIESHTVKHNPYEEETEIQTSDRNIKFFSCKDFADCFRKTESSLGIEIFRDN